MQDGTETHKQGHKDKIFRFHRSTLLSSSQLSQLGSARRQGMPVA
jgi:hypothetical protein